MTAAAGRALALLAVSAGAAEAPEVEVRPIRRISILPAGAGEVGVTFRLEVTRRGRSTATDRIARAAAAA